MLDRKRSILKRKQNTSKTKSGLYFLTSIPKKSYPSWGRVVALSYEEQGESRTGRKVENSGAAAKGKKRKSMNIKVKCAHRYRYEKQ